jgi:cytochrome c-type biogenesis protein CcmH
MLFWIITTALALGIAAILALVLLRARPDNEPAAAYDLRVYRDQIKGVDRDLARGVIVEADAERVRAEISRRILTADEQLRSASEGRDQPRKGSWVAAVLLGVTVIAGALILYRSLGAPGYGDLALADRIEMAATARSERPRQSEAEKAMPQQPSRQQFGDDYLALMERLRETVASRPGDLQGQTLLARNEAVIGNFRAAYEAQAKVLELKADAANSGDFTDYADMMILAAGGYVSPEAEAALLAALRRDARNGPARYYWGLMMSQTGRPDVSFQIWDQLLREGPQDAPWNVPIRAQIEEMAYRAGADFTMPPSEPAPVAPALRGPSAEDVQAAGDMSEADRTALVRSMVQRLSDRLATEGGSPPEWARLIGALGVLGEKDQAKAVYDNALEVFAEDETALQAIDASARKSGLIP